MICAETGKENRKTSRIRDMLLIGGARKPRCKNRRVINKCSARIAHCSANKKKTTHPFSEDGPIALLHDIFNLLIFIRLSG